MSKQQFTIFSSRKLSTENKQLFTNHDLQIIDVDLLVYEYLNNEQIKNALLLNSNPLVFTSQQAVKSVLNVINKFSLKLPIYDCFCISGITAELATANNFNVLATAPNSALLATQIINKNARQVLFCCGNLKLDDLQNILAEKNIAVNELLVYNKHLQPYKLQQNIAGILFFSPSQIDAFLMQNELAKTTMAFCIGDTTANYLLSKNYTNFQVAKHSSLNEVIEMAIEYFNSQKYLNF
jgi:uroporphyrinogen-III synthase